MNMVELIYRITEDLPSKENFRLTPQMRRAAVAVPSNTAK
jgi:four helix bundle protein